MGALCAGGSSKVDRHDFREYFGTSSLQRCGHFLDWYLSTEVFVFADWIDVYRSYPKGERELCSAIRYSQVWSAVISSDGRDLFMGTQQGTVKWYDLTNDTSYQRSSEMDTMLEWVAHESGYISSMIYHSSGIVFTASDDCSMKQWDLKRQSTMDGDHPDLMHCYQGHSDIINDLCLNDEETEIFSCSSDCSIIMWSVNNGECLSRITSTLITDSIQKVCFVGDIYSNNTLMIHQRSVIIGASYDSSMTMWDVSDLSVVNRVHNGMDRLVRDLCVNSDCSLAAYLFLSSLYLFNLNGDDNGYLQRCRMIRTPAFRGCFHPSLPHILAVVGMNRSSEPRVYDAQNGTLLRKLRGQKDGVFNMSFTPDGSRLILISFNGMTSMRDVSDLLS